MIVRAHHALLAALVMTAAPAYAATDDAPGFLRLAWLEVEASLAAAVAELEPALVPPVAVKVRWRARRVASVDLKAPLLAMTAADVDGDGRAEVIALTTREVVVISRKGKLEVLGRGMLPRSPARMRPRHPVGVVVTARTPSGDLEVIARTSEQAEGGVYRWQEAALVEVGRAQGYALGAGVSSELEAGKNYFVASQTVIPAAVDAALIPSQFFVALQRLDLRDPIGRPLRVLAFLATDGELRLRIDKSCRSGDDGCASSIQRAFAHAGVAIAVADVDNDGYPEVVMSADRAPGDPDRVTVVSTRSSPGRLFTKEFNGGVAGVAVADFDGDGDGDVVAAVRLLGSSRFDLWSLNAP